MDILAWVSLILILLLSVYSARSLFFIHTIKSLGAKRKDPSLQPSSYTTTTTIKNFSLVFKYDKEQYLLKSNDDSNLHRHDYHYYYCPFVSIIIATHNEALVIERLLRSLAKLNYPSDKFEIIVVDDSTDGTYEKIRRMSAEVPNLRAVHRTERTGWKGGALNLGIELMDKRASFVLVLDADNVVADDVLKRFVQRFSEIMRADSSVAVIQGFPISKSDPEEPTMALSHGNGYENGNWVSRGIDFRLAQRNMIEFAAKNELGLPLQITGSLFMARADVFKSLRFSGDLCEDWDLTLDIYCCYNHHNSNNLQQWRQRQQREQQRQEQMISNTEKRHYYTHSDGSEEACYYYGDHHHNNNGDDDGSGGSVTNDANSSILTTATASANNNNNNNKKDSTIIESKPRIFFDPQLTSYCEATTNFASYFRQRMRVSEGHTRGFRRKAQDLLIRNRRLSLTDKFELFLTGLQYAKFIPVLALGLLDAIMLAMALLAGWPDPIIDGKSSVVFAASLILQAANLFITFAATAMATRICSRIRTYSVMDVLSVIVLNTLTIPAFVLGSTRGFLRNQGIFYRTQRNIIGYRPASRSSTASAAA